METEHINNWHSVWSKRKQSDTISLSILEKLISLDGFDSPLGFMHESQWRDYIDLFSKRSGIAEGHTIFEVGCGGGAFLYPFYESGYKVSGIDYSHEMILVSQSAMPDRKEFLNVSEANSFRKEPREDVVLANHVFHYFPSLAYSLEVLTNMLQKAKTIVVISGIPNLVFKNRSEELRRGLLGKRDYDLKYKGLDILYYEKSWFDHLAHCNGFTVKFFEHDMPGFAQNPFRFDCVMTKVN